MSRTECGRSRCRAGVAVGKVALIVLAVLTATSSAPASEQEMNQEASQIYQHTYDEVFQASQNAVERKGWFVTASDKDKGIISGTIREPLASVFNIHVEALNTKPETRATIQIKWRFKGSKRMVEQIGTTYMNSYLSELQKVLSTY